MDADLVRRLLAAQFPEWAALRIEPVDSSGTVNALYRLGEEMVVRLPRTEWGVGAVERQLEWLPKLAPLLPVAIPVPLAKGAPGDGYPWEWGVCSWLPGATPTVGQLTDVHSLALELARFIKALRAVDLGGGPPAPRGSSLARWDEPTRAALQALAGVIDTDAASEAWEAALRTPTWDGPEVWVHGDLMPGNLLVQDGRLTGVLDWEISGLADPACDLALAWNLLPQGARDTFRAELGVDEATWARGRGWALWTGLVALLYYKHTNPEFADNARYRIHEVLDDYRVAG